MNKIFFVNIQTNLLDLKFEKQDIVIAFDIESFVILQKKSIYVKYFGSYLDKKGHLYIAKNTKFLLSKLSSFNFVDRNGLNKSYTVNFERKIYFFLNNYYFLDYVFKKIFQKYKKNKFTIINHLPDKYNVLQNIDNENNFFSFFYNKFNRSNLLFIKKKNKKNFLNNIIFQIIYLFISSKYLLLYNNDYGMEKYVNILKKKYKFNKILFFLNFKTKINYFNKYFKYKLLTFSIQDRIFFFNNKDKRLKKYTNNYLKNIDSKISRDKRLRFLLKNYINNYLFHFMNDLVTSSENIFRFLKKKKPSVILSRLTSNIGYSIAEISKKLEINSYIVSHASHVFNKDKLSMFDWLINSKSTINSMHSHVAAQSILSLEFLKKIKVKSKIINTGPIIFCHPTDENKLEDYKKNFNKKIILHASTPKDIINFRAINYETTYDYIKNLNDQILSLSKRKDIFFIIKFREYDFLKLNDFKYLLPKTENYKVDTNNSLKSLLKKCDYVSSYSSTVIEEGFFFGKDVILYDRNNIYRHISRNKIKYHKNKISKIHYCTNPKNLNKIFT